MFEPSLRGIHSCLIMWLVRAHITAAWLSSLNKESDPTPIWAAMFFFPLTSFYYCRPSTTAPPPPLCHGTPPPSPLPLPLCVWQSHSRPCVCWRRYIMPSFHCTPDQREQSSTEKLLLADFLLFHHHIVLSDFSTQRLYSRLHYYLLRHSPSCWKPNGANGEWSEVRCKKWTGKRLNQIGNTADASGVKILHFTFWRALIHLLV